MFVSGTETHCGADSEAGAWDSASQPVQEFGLSAELEEAGDKPMPLPPAKGGLAPLGQPGGGLAPLGKPAPGGLAPLKPMGTSLPARLFTAC